MANYACMYDSVDKENDEVEHERTLNFKTIIEETLQSVIDNGENVEVGKLV